MPLLNIKVTGPRLLEQQLVPVQRCASDLVVQVMRKKGPLTAVRVKQTSTRAWRVSGDVKPSATVLEAKVTAGTNTPAEKGRFAMAERMLLAVIRPALNPVTYGIVHEAPAEAWGYGGFT